MKEVGENARVAAVMALSHVIWLTLGSAPESVFCVPGQHEHAYDLMRGTVSQAGRLTWSRLTVDGLIYASSMVVLDSARQKVPVRALARA